jgi:hypothetical protein
VRVFNGVRVMGRYRKKPVEIEAVRVDEILYLVRSGPVEQIPSWLKHGEGVLFHASKIEIQTLEGTMTASAGDWIIRGVKGELYPCRNDIFVATYDGLIDD